MRYMHGLIAGLTATIVLSLLMFAKQAMGLLPELNVIRMLYQLASEMLTLPAVPITGWLAHFAVGTVLWGLLFAASFNLWRGPASLRGVEFSVAAWLLMMLVLMPLAGAGIFGSGGGIAIPIATLVLHVVFGVVLGWTYGWLSSRPETSLPAGRTSRQTISPTAGMRR